MSTVADDDRPPVLNVADLVHRPAVRWPAECSVLVGIPEATLRAMRARGDAPRLYALGRALLTTVDDIRAWVESHEIGADVRLRAAGPGRPRKSSTGPT